MVNVMRRSKNTTVIMRGNKSPSSDLRGQTESSREKEFERDQKGFFQ